MMIKHAALLAASIGAFAAAVPAAHATIVVDFSFSDNLGQSVAGVLDFAGNGTNIAATSVELTSVVSLRGATGAPLLNENLLTLAGWTIDFNNFTLADNTLTAADLWIREYQEPYLILNYIGFNFFNDQFGLKFGNQNGFAGATYTTVSAPPLPEPMSLALLAAGIGGLAVLRRRG